MTRGLVFDLQHYAVHDGPGIRTLVFLKGCPLRCAWCCNPESQAAVAELRHLRARCTGCFRCAEACPDGVVGVESGDGKNGDSPHFPSTENGGCPHFSPAREVPVFDRARCLGCTDRRCIEVCVDGALGTFGTWMTVDEVVARVAADLAFYRNSGGGVTFSGGEPLAQPGFLAEVLGRCRDLGIHTALGTCGHAPADVVDRIEPLVDLFLFDLKAADPERHRALTGVPNDKILDNLRRLARKRAASIVVRVPLVPGATDDPAELAAIASIAGDLGVARVVLAPYHGLGAGKYGDLGRDPPDRFAPPTAAGVRDALRQFTDRGVRCELEPGA